jgi:hypothetical protein
MIVKYFFLEYYVVGKSATFFQGFRSAINLGLSFFLLDKQRLFFFFFSFPSFFVCWACKVGWTYLSIPLRMALNSCASSELYNSLIIKILKSSYSSIATTMKSNLEVRILINYLFNNSLTNHSFTIVFH